MQSKFAKHVDTECVLKEVEKNVPPVRYHTSGNNTDKDKIEKIKSSTSHIGRVVKVLVGDREQEISLPNTIITCKWLLNEVYHYHYFLGEN